jgi:transcriptional regulator with XRE-family HTH domain
MRINGAVLTVVRERTGMSQADLARKTGIAKETLSRLESGKRPGTAAQIKAISEALDVDWTILTAAPVVA